MKISFNWIQEYVKDKLPKPAELADLLTMNSFEVESVEKEGKDSVLDVKILPNRAHDCLSHLGVASEIASIAGFALKKRFEFPDTKKYPVSGKVEVAVEEGAACRRYIAAYVSGVKIGPSPAWLREKIEAIGQRSINNVVDATNYVMFSVGQPLHAFDADKLSANEDGKKEIYVRNAKASEKLVTLDGKEADFGAASLKGRPALLITDGVSGEPLAIAGVKGGTKAEIDSNTKNIILESANFDPVSVRLTSKALGIRTDASVRFENGIAPELASLGIRDVLEVILDMAGSGKKKPVLEGVAEYFSEKSAPRKVEVASLAVRSVLGVDLEVPDIKKILARLGFGYSEENGIFTVEAPVERLDINIPQDVIEEVGRIYGLARVPSTPLPPSPGKASVNRDYYFESRIRSALLKLGFSEVITYAMRSRGEVELDNPMASDKAFMRDSLFQGVRESLDFNLRYADLLGLRQVKIFEIGKVFRAAGERTSLAMGVANQTGGKMRKEEDIIAEALSAVSASVGVDVSKTAAIEKNVALIDLADALRHLAKPASYEPAQLALSDVEAKYVRPSQYPFVIRDIAVFVPESARIEDVQEAIRKKAGELLVRLTPFDIFKKAFPDGETKVSYAHRLIFQSHEKTLSDDEVNAIMEKVTKALNAEKGWKVR